MKQDLEGASEVSLRMLQVARISQDLPGRDPLRPVHCSSNPVGERHLLCICGDEAGSRTSQR